MADIKIKVQLKNSDNYLTINKSSVNLISSLSQTNSNADKVFYGVLSNDGSLEIVDKNAEIKNLINEEKIDDANVSLEIYVNNDLVQTHKTTTSEYKDNILKLQLSDNLKDLSKAVFVDSYSTPIDLTALDMLHRICDRSYPIISLNIIELNKSIPYDTTKTGTLTEYLDLIHFKNVNMSKFYDKPTLDVLNYFCEATQTNIVQSKNGNLGISLSRPIFDSFTNAIYIPNKYIYKNEENSIFLNNKYKRVVIKTLDSQDKYKSKVYKTSSNKEYSESETINIKDNPLLTEGSLIQYRVGYNLEEYIAKNILNDYYRGIRTRNITISCSDLYYENGAVAKNWAKGETVELNDIVKLEGVDNKYWKITSKEFTFKGQPMLNLQVQECIKSDYLEAFEFGLFKNNKLIYTWDALIEENLITVSNNTIKSANNNLDGELKIHPSITSIDDYAFEGCSKLIKVEFYNVATIGEYAFKDCTLLEDITLFRTSFVQNPQMTKVPNGIFYNCTSLKRIDLPAKFKYIGEEAFYNCSSLTTVNSSELESVETRAFYNCTSLERNPSSKNISTEAYYGCTSITNVGLGTDIENIEVDAFKNCVNLTSLDVSTPIVKFINRFDYVKKVTLWATVKDLNNAFNSNNKIEIIDARYSKITQLHESEFTDCASLKYVLLPQEQTLLTIGKFAFNRCYSLQHLFIPNSVNNILVGLSEQPKQKPFMGCNESAKIYCESTGDKPGWGENWKAYNYSNGTFSYLSVNYEYTYQQYLTETGIN